jgi:transcriptional regulator with XRE-family HTH domain
MGFAQRLKKARTDKGLSQTELGSLAGIHYTQIGRYENKGAQPSADVLSKLANALGVSSDYLTNGSTDELAENTLNDKELLNQFKAIEKMTDTDKSVVKTLIDAFITKRKIQQLAS